ncbi:hypothetical protein, partial [Streptomyces sp. OR43]|uniref:hypothetical protein n=1 Tax=Streptomyces sp. or43 TaxID=2478957 RepID=UPI0013A35AFA
FGAAPETTPGTTDNPIGGFTNGGTDSGGGDGGGTEGGTGGGDDGGGNNGGNDNGGGGILEGARGTRAPAAVRP